MNNIRQWGPSDAFCLLTHQTMFSRTETVGRANLELATSLRYGPISRSRHCFDQYDFDLPFHHQGNARYW